MRFRNNPFDPLDQYYFRSSQDTIYANMIWLLLIFISLVVLSITLIQKFVRSKKFSGGEIIVSALVITGLSILILYSYLGASDMSFIIFSSIIGLSILYDNYSKDYSKFLMVIIYLLLVLNVYTTISTYVNFNDGMRDWNYGQYINAPSKWYLKYMFNEESIIYETTTTDLFTESYFSKEIVKQNRIYSSPALSLITRFSRNHMLYILKPDTEISRFSNVAFIINYRLYRISVQNWDTFSSWSNHRKIIVNNHHLNSIYSSGDIIIYITPK